MMMDDSVLIQVYEPSTQELLSAYILLIIGPFLIFIVLLICIMLECVI